MIVVRIEMWPKGDRKRARLLGLVNIINDGTAGNGDIGHYDVGVATKRALRAMEAGKDPAPFIKQGRIDDWKRKARTIYALVGQAIKAAKAD